MTTLARVFYGHEDSVDRTLGIRLPLGLARDLWAASPLEGSGGSFSYQGGNQSRPVFLVYLLLTYNTHNKRLFCNTWVFRQSLRTDKY
jgi:hypothetical protein